MSLNRPTVAAEFTDDFYEIIEFGNIGWKGRIRIIVFIRNVAYREEITSTGNVQITTRFVGSAQGDVVTAELPGGTRKLEIVNIEIYS